MNHANNRMRNTLIALAIVIAPATAAIAAHVPSLNEVYGAARAGDLPRADAMMRQVLSAYPNSARAHYAYAQILAAEDHIGPARAQLDEAERIAPGLPFVSPQALANLRRRLQAGSAPAAPRHSSGGGFPWYWLLAAGGVVLFLLARRRRSAYRGSYQNPSNPNAPGYGAGPQPYSGGSGLWGSILSGLGFGAGAAAGEYALDRFLDRGGRQTQEIQPNETPVAQPGDNPDNLGGDDFGMSGGNQNSGGWTGGGDDQSASGGDQPSGNDDSGDFGMSNGGGDDGGWDDSSGGGGDNV